jgi:hypothetical protein
MAESSPRPDLRRSLLALAEEYRLKAEAIEREMGENRDA